MELFNRRELIFCVFPVKSCICRCILSSQMSWLTAASSFENDVFDENADEMSVMSKEWASNMKKRIRVNTAGCVCCIAQSLS